MGALVIQALRFLFIAIVQTAAYLGAAKVLEGLVDYLRDALKKDGKLGDEQIDDVMLNDVLDTLALIGVTVASLKTKIPVRLADKLGLKLARPVKKALSPAVKAGVAKAAAAGVFSSANIKKALGVFSLSLIGSLPWLPGLVQQFGDQATFNPKNANNYYEGLFGIRPFQEPNSGDSPGSFTGSEFEEYYLALEAAGAYALSNPCKMVSAVFSKETLTDLVRCIYGIQNVSGLSTTATKLKVALAPYVKTKNAVFISSPVTSTPSLPKVYTGVVSQGVVGQGLTFTARPDDLIESLDELRAAAANNLAPYLSTVLRKIVYEVKVVSSVITKDGFKQTGTVQKIPSGTWKDGTTKYKTVTNKFAVLDIFAVTDKGSRAKLTTIVLGPTDSAKLSVGQNDLRSLEDKLPAIVTTQDTAEIKNIKKTEEEEKDEKPSVKAVEREQYTNAAGEPALYTEVTKNADGSLHIVWRDPKKGTVQDDGDYFPDSAQFLKIVAKRGVVGYKYDRGSNTAVAKDPAPVAGPAVSEPSSASAKPGAGATTLFEWYQAQGLSLPSVEERSTIYADLGLGQSTFYTGTSEQNSKLLNALKEK